MRQLASLLILTMLSGGCYSWTAIKPTELPKLNGAQTTTSHQMGRQVILISAAQVETPDGRLVEIQGESDAKIQVPGAVPLLFAASHHRFRRERESHGQIRQPRHDDVEGGPGGGGA